MIIDQTLLSAVGLNRTHDTVSDTLNWLKKINAPQSVIDAYENSVYPFYRFFSNYGTGIGETIEEIVGSKFAEFIDKKVEVVTKRGKTKKVNNPIYEELNKKFGKKPSNYDHLATLYNRTLFVEEKVIRAASAKPKEETKLHEIPSLLEERALTYAEREQSGNGTFQQTKAHLFDYLLGAIVYKDQIDFYWVPSEDISSGKLKIGNQHAGAIKEDGSTKEGHLSFKELDVYRFLSVYSEEELLAADSLAKYIK